MKSTLVLALALAVLAVAAAPRLVADPKPLPAKHKTHGCIRCHGEEAPTAAPKDDSACMNCHGDMPAMAAETKDRKVNPHNPGSNRLCWDCHHQHKAAEGK